MSHEFTPLAKTSGHELADLIDKKLVAFFGSQEEAYKYAHLYVLEQTPVAMEAIMQPELSGDYFTLFTEVKYRIRPKTLAELEEDRRD